MSTPRQRFQLSGLSEKFKGVVASESFELACDYALLQLFSELPPNNVPGSPTDPYVGLDANAQAWGARRVIEILQHLHEPEKEPKQSPKPTLNYG